MTGTLCLATGNRRPFLTSNLFLRVGCCNLFFMSKQHVILNTRNSFTSPPKGKLRILYVQHRQWASLAEDCTTQRENMSFFFFLVFLRYFQNKTKLFIGYTPVTSTQEIDQPTLVNIIFSSCPNKSKTNHSCLKMHIIGEPVVSSISYNTGEEQQ